MKTLHLSIIIFLAVSLVAVNNSVFADNSTSTAYGGLVGFRQAYFQGNHGSYPIWYKLTNGTAVSTLLDLPAKALLFMIHTSSDGQLIVELPRSIIDSKNQNADKPYFVGLGGITTGLSQVNATETNDDYLRTLKIGFTKNTDEIEIVGTFFVENYSFMTKHSSILLSPLKQFKSGIKANDVKCDNGLSLVIKSEDGYPACVKSQTTQRLVERGWGWAMQTMDSIKPSLQNRIIGLENDTGTVTFGNQTYYFVTPNYTNTAYSNQVQISFHDVVFTLFPPGFRGGLPSGGCGSYTVGEIVVGGGSYYWADAKFSDSTHELLHIFADSQPCPIYPKQIYFSTHTNPQAGLTFYDGKMKLLVNTNTLNSNVASDHIVDLVSIKSVPPVTPGGPTIQITLKNNNAKPITSLNATLELYNSYVFNFNNVTKSNPLISGNSVSETEILIGGGFTSESTYPVIINGIADNIPFRYSENVTIPYTKEIVRNTIPASFEPCDTPYMQSNNGIAVLYIPTNSVGKICVRYSNGNDTPEPIFGIRIFDPNNSNQNATGITTWNDIGNNYTIPKGGSTVVYWIKTGNQTGFYGLNLFCGGTPFAVGYDNNSKIVSSDFPFVGLTYSCPAMTYEYHIDSLTGIGVKYIPYP